MNLQAGPRHSSTRELNSGKRIRASMIASSGPPSMSNLGSLWGPTEGWGLYRVWGLGFRVWGLGFRVLGFGV